MMDITEKVQEWLENARERFFALDLRELDESLTPEERVEWDNIYASFRSGSLMRGRIIGLEHMPRPEAASGSAAADSDGTDMPCICLLYTSASSARCCPMLY